MSLIRVRRIATLDGEDKRDGKDSVADKEREYTRLYELAQKNITFYAAKGDSAKVAEWKRKADEYKRLAQEAENAAEARNAKDSCAEDAKFKIGDKVRRGMQTGIVRGIEKAPYIEVKFTDEPVTVFVRESEIVAADSRAADNRDSVAKDAKFQKGDKVIFVKSGESGTVNEVYGNEWYAVWRDGAKYPDKVQSFQIKADNSRAADACGTDAKLQKGDKVRVWQYPVYGKLGEVVEATYGGMEYTVNVEGKDYPRIDYRRIVKVSDAAGDAAEFHVGQRVRAKDPAYEYSDGKALGDGMFTVKEVNNNGDVKLDDYGDVWISPSALVEANDACGKGEDAEKFRVGQKVRHTRFGTIGKVFEIAPDGGIGVQWSNGQAYYGEFHRPLSEIVAVN